mmetsp:Transcript_69196/g.218906  ORF Transcript_69196/g.218906 Transcript_69196/m.218906 type:complete len:278 (-) Transcript_69196:1685-2518(-)
MGPQPRQRPRRPSSRPKRRPRLRLRRRPRSRPRRTQKRRPGRRCRQKRRRRPRPRVRAGRRWQQRRRRQGESSARLQALAARSQTRPGSRHEPCRSHRSGSPRTTGCTIDTKTGSRSLRRPPSPTPGGRGHDQMGLQAAKAAHHLLRRPRSHRPGRLPSRHPARPPPLARGLQATGKLLPRLGQGRRGNSNKPTPTRLRKGLPPPASRSRSRRQCSNSPRGSGSSNPGRPGRAGGGPSPRGSPQARGGCPQEARAGRWPVTSAIHSPRRPRRKGRRA